MENFQEILNFWFGEDPRAPLQNAALWFKKDPAFDAEIARRFEKTLVAAVAGKMAAWLQSPQGTLAYVILLDQFSRNIYRDQPGMFANDLQALPASLQLQHSGKDLELTPVQRWFLYLPMMHSEDLGIQEQCVTRFKQLTAEAPAPLQETLHHAYQFALKHLAIIERFGRFPHRNAILGRPSTPEEIKFLQEPGSSF